MTNKPIKEYEDFSGEAGYLIVDSLTNETSGGKLKVPNYVGVTDGYVLTKTSNSGTDEVVWAQVESSGITNAVSPLIIPAGYNDKIELQYDSNTLDVNGSNELTVKDPIPDTTGANDGDVLTYDSSDGIVWAAPQGGGGGNNTVYLELSVNNDNDHLTAASMTPQQIISTLESGTNIVARIVKTNNNTIFRIVYLPFGDYYNGASWNDGYTIWFGPAGGSGANWSGDYVRISTMGEGLSWTSSQWKHSDIDES